MTDSLPRGGKMRELIPDTESGFCGLTELPTNYRYNGNYIHLSFLTAANKLCNQYPEKDFDEAMEIILSAQVYRNHFGEDNMSVQVLRAHKLEVIGWKNKIKNLLKK